MVIISAVTLVVLVLKWNDLLLVFFDANQARSIGLNTALLHFMLLHAPSATAGGGAANGRRVPGRRDAGHARGDGLPSDGSVRER